MFLRWNKRWSHNSDGLLFFLSIPNTLCAHTPTNSLSSFVQRGSIFDVVVQHHCIGSFGVYHFEFVLCSLFISLAFRSHLTDRFKDVFLSCVSVSVFVLCSLFLISHSTSVFFSSLSCSLLSTFSPRRILYTRDTNDA